MKKKENSQVQTKIQLFGGQKTLLGHDENGNWKLYNSL